MSRRNDPSGGAFVSATNGVSESLCVITGRIAPPDTAGAEMHPDGAHSDFIGLPRDPPTDGAPTFPPRQSHSFMIDRHPSRLRAELAHAAAN